MTKITSEDPVASLVQDFLREGLGLYVMHTNFDKSILTREIAKKMAFFAWQYLGQSKKDNLFKIAVFVPKGYEDKLRGEMADAGAGQLGNYSHSFFMTSGTGTFKPENEAQPFLGKLHRLETVDEQKLETIVCKENLPGVLRAMEKAHPYEEIAYDIYPLANQREMGFGILGRYEQGISLTELKEILGRIFPFKTLKCSPGEIQTIKKIAVVPGKGGKFIEEAARKGAEVFISGDLDYHQFRQAEDLGLFLIDLGHYPLEVIAKEIMAKHLKDLLDPSLELVLAQESPEAVFI